MKRGRRPTRATTLIALTTLGVLLLCPCGFASDPSLDISQYAHTAWKIRDGFAKGYIASIAQTPDGYLWLGTEFGLLRFDGVRPVPWQPPRNQHLPPGTIFSLLAARRDGTLWIGATGLASWKDGKLTQYPELANQFIFALFEDSVGDVWVGSAGIPTGKLCSIHQGSVHCYSPDGGFGIGVFALYEDSKGNLWAGVKDGLWRWNHGHPEFYSLPGERNGIRALAEDTDGALLVGWKDSLYRFVDGKTEAYSLAGKLGQIRANRILHDRNGGLWIGTTGRGLLHVHEGRTDVFLPSDGLSGDEVAALFEDREGNIWVSTLGGLDRFRDFAAATFTVKQGLSKDVVVSVLADKYGSVWLSTRDGLNQWEHGEIKIPRTGSAKRDGTLNGFYANSLFQDDRGRIWISTSRELGYLENGRFTSIKGVPGGDVLSIVQDTAGNLWVINEHVGLFRISPQNDVRQILWSELEHKDHASVLAADRRQGGLWIGFFLGGIAYFADGQARVSYKAADGLGAGRVSDFQFDDDGALWASTEGGLSRLKDSRVATLTSKNGLPCDTVHWAIEDDDHSMWLYTACGLVRIARSELDAWAADPKRTIQTTVLDSSDGVRSLSSPGHYHPQVAKTPDGKIWFLPWDGVSVIDPRNLAFNKLPPPVHIEQIVADGKTYDLFSQGSGGMHLPPRVRDLAIEYTALSLVVPEKVRFRFKLEGQDTDWREVVNQRRVEYSNLPPRHYRFRVLACNNSGVWNEEGAALDFAVDPAYWQTNWFRALCAAAFLGMLWALHRLRLRQLAHQFDMTVEARVGERTRIARELHDTLLQSFQGLMLRFQTVDEMLPTRPTEAKEALGGALERADQAIIEGRDAISDIRASAVGGHDLAKSMTALMTDLSEERAAGDGGAVTFRVLVEGTPRSVSPILQDEIYRIARESLRNAFRHAEARSIETEITYSDSLLRLRFRDDGKGIDPRVLERGGRSRHWGLPGIRERAKQIGAQLEVWSELGAGTEVELSIPGGIAYEASAARGGFGLFRRRMERDHEHRS